MGVAGGREKCQICLDCVTPDVGSAARRLFNSPAALSPSFERRPLARSLLQEVFGEQLSPLVTSGARRTPRPRQCACCSPARVRSHAQARVRT